MKRCLTIQDFSSMGRCSLSVALPILSAAEVESIGLPTAVLSNHTAFDHWTYTDLTSKLEESVDQWMDYNHHFDGIYTGYLGMNQPAIITRIMEKLKTEDTKVIIDPAFGDEGKLYTGFEPSHVDDMRNLLKHAYLVCPNVTEACFLLNVPYVGERLDDIQIQRITTSLSLFGPRKIVVTGIINDQGQIGCAIFDRDSSDLSYYFTEPVKGFYHGSGDCFASALVGSILNGISLLNAVRIAHDFVRRSMQRTIQDSIDGRIYGIEFESQLFFLHQSITKAKRREEE